MEFLCLRQSWQNWNQVLTATGKLGGTVRFVWLWTCAFLEPHRNTKHAFLYKGLKRNGWKYHFNYMDNCWKLNAKLKTSSSRYHQLRPIHCQILHTAQNWLLTEALCTANNNLKHPFPPIVNSNLGFTKGQVFISHGNTKNCTLSYSGKAHVLIFLSLLKGR